MIWKQIFITGFMMIMISSIAYAGICDIIPIPFFCEEEEKEPQINYTYKYSPLSDMKCNGRNCIVNVYQDYRYIDDNGTRVDKAKSLKNTGFFVSYIDKDKNITLDILDFNYTSIVLKPNEKTGKDILFRLWENNQSDTSRIATGDYKQDLINTKTSTILAKDLNKEQTYEFGIGKVLEFGKNSTVITLQENLTGNLADSHIENTNPTANFGTYIFLLANTRVGETTQRSILIKFNTSNSTIFADDIIINQANLSLFHSRTDTDGTSEGYYIVAQHLYYNYSWTETGVNWILKPNVTKAFNGTYSDILKFTGSSTSYGVYIGWKDWNVTPIVQDFYNQSNISFYLNATNVFGTPAGTDYQTFFSRNIDVTNITRRPKLVLDITYPEIITNNCSYVSGNWVINCSYYCNLSLTNINRNNITLYGNGTVTGFRNATNYTYGLIKEGCYVKN